MAVTSITYNSQHSLDAGNATPHGMTRVPSEAAARRLWIANNSDDQIYKYSDAVAYNSKLALPSGNTQPRGLAYDTKRDEVVSLNNSGHIYRITPATGASPGKYALNTANAHAEAIIYFESIDEYWVVDRLDRLFYRYKGADGSFIATFALNNANVDARGGCFVAGEAWVLNATDKKVFRYGPTGNYIGLLDLDTAHQTPRAMAKVGSKLFVADNGTDTIFDYTLTGSPIIAAISSPLNFVVNTAVDFEVRVDLATKVSIDADWEGLYYNWDANTGKLHIEGTPAALVTHENFTITATAADASTTTATGTYNVTTPAPIITRPTGTVHFVKGKPANLLIPVSNNPIQVNVKGAIIGADHEPEDTGIRIGGNPIPTDANFTITSGAFDVDALNTGGVDTQNNIPFNLLTTEPSFTTFTAAAGFKLVTLTYTKPTDARVMAAKVWKSAETEPNDDLENWQEIGASPAAIAGLDAGEEYKVKMRVNQAFIGTKTTITRTVTPTSFFNLHNDNNKPCGIFVTDNYIVVGNAKSETESELFYYNKSGIYQKKAALTGISGLTNYNIYQFSLAADENHIYVGWANPTQGAMYCRRYNHDLSGGQTITQSVSSTQICTGLSVNSTIIATLIRVGSGGLARGRLYTINKSNFTWNSNYIFTVSNYNEGGLVATDSNFYTNLNQKIRVYNSAGTYQSGQDKPLPNTTPNSSVFMDYGKDKILYLGELNASIDNIDVVENLIL